MPNLLTTSFASAVAAVALLMGGVSFAPVQATTIIMHNGTVSPPPGGYPVLPLTGSGEVNVDLFDATQSCGIFGPAWIGQPDVCLLKEWENGSLGQVHYMMIPTELLLNTGGLLEVTVNDTGTPWSDYHINLFGGTFVQVLGALIPVNGLGFPVGPPDLSVVDVQLMNGNMAWFFFDTPVLPFDEQGENLIFAFEATILPDSSNLPYLTISQHPSIPEPATLALFGLGLAGLGFARRRKEA